MDNNRLFTIVKIAIIASVILYIIFSKNHDNGYDLILEEMKMDKYSGVVEKKFIDSENHNTPTIVLNTGKRLTLYGQYWDKIAINDSLLKNKNTTIIKVFKKNEVIEVDEKDYILHLKQKNK